MVDVPLQLDMNMIAIFCKIFFSACGGVMLQSRSHSSMQRGASTYSQTIATIYLAPSAKWHDVRVQTLSRDVAPAGVLLNRWQRRISQVMTITSFLVKITEREAMTQLEGSILIQSHSLVWALVIYAYIHYQIKTKVIWQFSHLLN